MTMPRITRHIANTDRPKLFKRSVLARPLLVFLVSVVVLAVVFGYSYTSSKNAIQQERLSAISLSAAAYFDRLDVTIASINNAIRHLQQNQNWQILAAIRGPVENYETLQQLNTAKERIDAIKNMSNIIRQVTVHFPDWQRTLYSDGELLPLDQGLWENARIPVNSIGAQMIWIDGTPYLTSQYDVDYPDLFSIVVELDLARFFKNNNFFQTIGVDMATFVFHEAGGELVVSENFHDSPDPGLTSRMPMEVVQSAGTTLVFEGKRYAVVTNRSTYSGLVICNLVRYADLAKPFTFQTQLVVVFAIVICLFALTLFYLMKKTIIRPIHEMVSAFSKLEKGNFAVRLTPLSADEFQYLFQSFDHMVDNLRALINDVYEKELLVERANFKQLQSQINPHFLYNSFYALSAMIKIEDTENAVAFCTYLAQYFQYITRNEGDVVALSAEYKHAFTYLEIMSMRNSRIEIEADRELPEEARNLAVPRLILQPVIENAFEHGMKTVHDQFRLQISFQKDGQAFRLVIDDNGTGLTDGRIAEINRLLGETSPEETTTALFNINRRLKTFFGPESGITFGRSALGGAQAAITIHVGNQELKT